MTPTAGADNARTLNNRGHNSIAREKFRAKKIRAKKIRDAKNSRAPRFATEPAEHPPPRSLSLDRGPMRGG